MNPTKKNMKRVFRFTLVELMLAMSIFAVLMLILMQIFSSTQDVWRKTGSKADSYESVRIVMNMLEADLTSAVYSPSNSSFFYFSNTKPSAGSTSTVLWLPTKKTYLMSGQKSLDVEVAYRWKPSGTAGTKQLYDLYYNITNDSSANYDYKTNSSAYTPIDDAADKLLLENVCDITIYCIRKNFNSYSAGTANNLPYVVEITIKVIDDDEQAKRQYASSDAPVRTFKRFILIDQGQEL